MEDPTEEAGLRPPGAAEEPASEAGAGPADLTAGEQRPAGGGRSATGEPRVDAALARLDELEGLPVTEHRAVFEDVHRRLRDVLGELDAGQALTAGQAAAPARGAGRPARPGR
jgi:hypothetical protein